MSRRTYEEVEKAYLADGWQKEYGDERAVAFSKDASYQGYRDNKESSESGRQADGHWWSHLFGKKG